MTRTWNRSLSALCFTLALGGFACGDLSIFGGKGDGNGAGDGDGDGNGVGDGDVAGDGDALGPAGGTFGIGGTGGTEADGSGGAPYVPMACSNQNPALSVTRLMTTTIASLGTPFPSDENDLQGPADWATHYGKSPEIIPFSSEGALDVLFQDQGSTEYAYVVRIVPSVDSYVVDVAYQVQSLGRIMGFTKDTSGNYYVATGVDEDDVVDADYPPNDIHRSNVVRIVKFDIHGCVIMESDVDMARQAANGDSEIIVNPMTAASSRLVWGGDRLLLVHGQNTEPDAGLGGTRHQKALSTHINALDGTVTRTSTMWVSHSFDQRALYDGSHFVELHLGDAYPRYVALGAYNDDGGDGSYSAFYIKGNTGANNTHTRLGGIVQTSDPTYGYLALFSTERSTNTGDGIQGTRDVALVRVAKDFVSMDTSDSVVDQSGASTQSVTSGDDARTNYVRWLTDLGEGNHAERPRIVALSGGEYIVLYERWTGGGEDFDGTFALRIDASGVVLAGPTEVPGEHHINRGDDIATLGGKAVYVTGGDGALHLNLVGSDLVAQRVSLP